jgi:peroxiredoxin
VAGSIRCANCGEEISSSSRFCPSCAARICPGCHGIAPPNVKFCPQCGFAIGASPLGSAEQSPESQQPPETIQPQHPPRVQPFPQLERQQAQPTGPPQPPPPPTPQPVSPTGLQDTPSVPTPRAASEYRVDRQFIKTHGYGLPTEAKDKAETKEQSTDRGAWGAQQARRPIPNYLIAIVVVIGIALIGFFTSTTDFGQGIINSAKDSIGSFLSGIHMPSQIPGTSENVTQIAITDVDVSGVSETGAIISWTTNKPATSQVMICDPNGLCTWTEPDKNLVTQHSVSVANLKPGTSYHYTALSLDDKQNEVKAEGDLVTLGDIQEVPLLVSMIMNTNSSQSTTTITWQTNKPATSQVEYGITESYGNATTVDNKLVTNHWVTLTGLSPATTYYFRVRSRGATGNEIISEGGRTFTTKQAVSIPEGTESAERAPDFSLPAINGNRVTLSSYRGKMVLLNFWASVPASRNELPIIQQIYDTWSKDKLTILTINIKESEKDVELFMSSKGLTLPVLLDSQGEIAAKYNVVSKPTSFLIDSSGIIQEVKPRPFRTVEELEASLNKLN